MAKNKVTIRVSPEFRDAVNIAAKSNPELRYSYKVCDQLIPMIETKKPEKVAKFEKTKKRMFDF
jgi:hypothetical protein